MGNRYDLWTSILKGFELYFPNIFESAIDVYPSGRDEATAVLKDGRVVAYDNIHNTIRRIPDIDYDTDDESTIREAIGNRLLRKLRRAGMTQTELSKQTNISSATIHKYIIGKTVPSLINAKKISNALKCSVEDLLYFND